VTKRRDTPVVRGEQVEKLLNALADPPEPHDTDALPQTTVLPNNTKEVLAQARELREDLARVIQAAVSLPAERCDFFVHSLQPWQSKLEKTKRQWKRALQGVGSTTPGTQQRQLAVEGAFASSGALAFLKVIYRPIKLADIVMTWTRIVILAVIAAGVFRLGQIIGPNVVASIALAIITFVLLDRFFVDRWLEPRLEARRFRTILVACTESIGACQNIEAHPQHLAAVLDGVIVRED
jgi:hypothetical protein